MLRSMICSKRIKVVVPSSLGIGTSLGRTLGTCTVANTVSSLFCRPERSAAILSVLLRINGNGRDASTAIGVSTG